MEMLNATSKVGIVDHESEVLNELGSSDCAEDQGENTLARLRNIFLDQCFWKSDLEKAFARRLG
jgi:hypothetical protein